MKPIPAKPKRKLLAVLVSAALLAMPAILRAESQTLPQTLRFAPLPNRSSPSPLYFDIPLAAGESVADILLLADNGDEASLLSLFDLQTAANGVSARFRPPIDFSAYYGARFTLRVLKADATGAASEEWLQLQVVAPDELAQTLRLVAVTDGSPQPDAIAFVVPGAVNATLDDIQYIDNGQPVSIQSLLDLSVRRDGGTQAELRNVDLDGMAGGDIELRARLTIQPNATPIARKLLLTPIRREALTQDATVDIATSGDNHTDAFSLALATSANIEVQDIALDNGASLLGLLNLTRTADGALTATPKTALDFDPHIGSPIALQVRKTVAGALYTQKITLIAQLPQPKLTTATDGTLAIDGRVAQGRAFRGLRYVLYADAAGTAELARANTGTFADLIADSEYHVGTVATAGDSTPLKSPLLATRTLPADPDVFTFGTANNLARNSVVASSPVTITGILGRAAISIVGGEYSIDNGAWTTAAGLVRNGQTLRVRGTAAHSYATASSVTLTVGTRSASFRLTTASEPDTTPDAFSFTDVAGQVLSTMVESNAIAVAGINAATSISVAGGEYQIDGGTWTSAAGTVTLGQTVKLRHTTSASSSTATHTTLTMGDISGTFTTTTAAPVVNTTPDTPVADTTPNTFNFTDLTNQIPDGSIETNEITVSGFSGTVNVSVTGIDTGIYSYTIIKNNIDVGTTTTAVGGDQLKIQINGVDLYGLNVNNITVHIGNGSDIFRFTTINGQPTGLGLTGDTLVWGGVAGATHYQLLKDGIQVEVITTASVDLSTHGSGSYSVRASSSSGTYWGEVSATIVYDNTLPATPTLTIDSGAAYTNATAVAVSITGDTDNVGVTGWFVSESSSVPDLGDFVAEPTTATISVGDGLKTLYVWTRDAAGNISLDGSDTIVLDTVAPTAMSFSGTTPDSKSAAYTNLVLDPGENLTGGSITSLTSSAGGVIGNLSINGSGQIKFDWTTPAAASSDLRAQGTDRAGNAFDITLTVNLPN